MADVNSVSQTAYGKLDWEHYSQYRPPYPPSLKDLIYRYHDQYLSGDRKLLVDVGGGVGISSTRFISDFQAIHLLDPSPDNHEQARVFLSEHVRSHNLHTKLDYTVAKAEDGDKHVRDASLVICATAAHFIDPTDLTRYMAGMLRPGGTLAIYSYWLPAFPDQSAALTIAFNEAAIAAMRLCIQPGKDGEGTRSLFEKAGARLTAGRSILDSIPVPADLFADVRRIRINPGAEFAFETYRSDPPVPCQPLPSRVGADEKKEVYMSGRHAEAEGWSLQVDLKWLHGMIGSILPGAKQLSQDEHGALFGTLDRVYAQECGDGPVRALFSVGIILATRRSNA